MAFTITESWLREHSSNGDVGWTRVQIEALGLQWRDVRGGWLRKQIGRTITDEQRSAFESGRGVLAERTIKLQAKRRDRAIQALAKQLSVDTN